MSRPPKVGPRKILVAYSIPPGSRKAETWNDGFVRAMELLEEDFQVTWWNCAEGSPWDLRQQVRREGVDFVIAKSNWRWVVDRFVRRALAFHPVRRGIMISGIAKPPLRLAMRFYDVLFYQTEWYGRRFRHKHPHALHAYGINKDFMFPPPEPVPQVWDWLFVGNMVPSKRPLELLGKKGRRLAIGDLDRSDPATVAALRRGRVEVRPLVGYEELRALYWSAGKVLVPATPFGGGERAVMEALACGTPVEIRDDNPKLAEVVQRAPEWDEYYYRDRLARGIDSAFAKPFLRTPF